MKLIALAIAISLAAPASGVLADDEFAANAAGLQADQAIHQRVSDLETTISLTIVPQVQSVAAEIDRIKACGRQQKFYNESTKACH